MRSESGLSETERRLKDEIAQLEAKARQTELYRVAAIGLRAFVATLEELSEDQRKALEFFVASIVPGVTSPDVADALALVQKESSDAVNSPLFTAANATFMRVGHDSPIDKDDVMEFHRQDRERFKQEQQTKEQ